MSCLPSRIWLEGLMLSEPCFQTVDYDVMNNSEKRFCEPEFDELLFLSHLTETRQHKVCMCSYVGGFYPSRSRMCALCELSIKKDKHKHKISELIGIQIDRSI